MYIGVSKDRIQGSHISVVYSPSPCGAFRGQISPPEYFEEYNSRTNYLRYENGMVRKL
jgi:hypothetical protein